MPATTDLTKPPATDEEALRLSVVIPCLNEAGNIERCVKRSREVLARTGIDGEVIVVDNNSSDGSGEIAARAGATVIEERRRGYGSAYLAGLDAARGEYIVMLDADLTYDFEEIPQFLAKMEDGAEVVIGDRMDNIQPGAMPWLHRYVGNPLLTGLLNLFYRTGVSDAHCGMRGMRREVLERLDLRSTGMEFASEMVVRASKENLRIAQVPIEYHPRGGESKLSSFRDGWRHLRYLLVHSPTHLFIVPGAALVALGVVLDALVVSGVSFFDREWGIHTLIAGALLAIVGTQVVALGLCAHAYGTYFMGERDPWFDSMRAPLSPRARPAAGRAGDVRGPRLRGGDRDRLDLGGLRRARTGKARGDRSHVHHRGHPDLLLLVPAVDPGAAPARRRIRLRDRRGLRPRAGAVSAGESR